MARLILKEFFKKFLYDLKRGYCGVTFFLEMETMAFGFR